jgi:hypothetical protein
MVDAIIETITPEVKRISSLASHHKSTTLIVDKITDQQFQTSRENPLGESP